MRVKWANKLHHICQAGVLIISGVGIAILSLPPDNSVQPWGYALGLASQPFHIIASAMAKQWGGFLLSLWFTGAWAVGIWNHLL